ncbi:hypothetical protein [Desulfonatronovibrio magnus]|nr:hypothetical protein [Desulfonatronovibrio magnus]
MLGLWLAGGDLELAGYDGEVKKMNLELTSVNHEYTLWLETAHITA